jgi:hypothetical protein
MLSVIFIHFFFAHFPLKSVLSTAMFILRDKDQILSWELLWRVEGVFPSGHELAQT